MMNRGLARANRLISTAASSDFGVDRPGLGERAPEPAARLEPLHLVGAPVEAQLRAGEQGMTGIPFGDVGERQFDRAAALGQPPPAPARPAAARPARMPRGSSSRSTHGSGEGADAVEPLANQSGAEAGALGGAHRQLRRQPTVNQRQTGLQRLRRGRPLEQLRQDRQTLEQRVFGLGVAGGQRPGVGLSRAAGDGVQIGSGRRGARPAGPRRSEPATGCAGASASCSACRMDLAIARVLRSAGRTPLGVAQPNFPFR